MQKVELPESLQKLIWKVFPPKETSKGMYVPKICMYDVVGSSALLPCKKTFDLLLCLSFFLMHVNLFFQMM